jgi:nitrate reductase (NAD(P)H)
MQGMMNNCWFRVKVGLRKSEDTGLNLTFEHPTQPGNLTGGWMVKTPAQSAEADAKLEIKETKIVQGGPPVRQITLREVRKHRKADSCWIVVRSKVYDCTPFMEDHPGGADSILINGGMDATEEFDAIHSAKAQAMLEEYYVGDLVASKDDRDLASGDDEQDAVSNLVSSTGRPVALNPKERQPFRLIEKEILSPDVRRCSLSS